MHVQVTQPCVMENRDAGQVLGSQPSHITLELTVISVYSVWEIKIYELGVMF